MKNIFITILFLVILVCNKSITYGASPCNPPGVSVTGTCNSLTFVITNISTNGNQFTIEISHNANMVPLLISPATTGFIGSPNTSTATITTTISNSLITPNTLYYIRVNICGLYTSISYRTPTSSCSTTIPVSLPANNIGCNYFKANWEINPCALYYILSVWNTDLKYKQVYNPILSVWQTVPYYDYIINNLNVGLTNNYLVTGTSGITPNLPAGNYAYSVRFYYRQSCIPTNTNVVLSSQSNIQYVTISGMQAYNAGPDISLPCTGGCVQLQATAAFGGTWSIVYPTIVQGGTINNLYFDNSGKISSTNAQAIFCPGSDFPYYILRWSGPCGQFDEMVVYTNFICGTTLYDSRNSKYYPTTSIGGKCWFKKNLNYGTQNYWYGATDLSTTEPAYPAGPTSTVYKYCINNIESGCDGNGAYYLGDFATNNTTLCPPCWHVASSNEWDNMILFAKNYSPQKDAGVNLYSDTYLGFNGLTASSFNSWLTTGFLFTSSLSNTSDPTKCWNGQNYSNGCFDYFPDNRSVYWWTSTAATCQTCYNTGGPSKYNYTKSGYATFKALFGLTGFINGQKFSGLFLNYTNPFARRDFAFPVRCIKN